MKHLYILLIFASFGIANAQKVSLDKVKFMNEKADCVVGEYGIPPKVMKNAVKDFFSDEGSSKATTKNGYFYFKKSKQRVEATELLELYVGVKGTKNTSYVTVLPVKESSKNGFTQPDLETISKFSEVLNNLAETAHKHYVTSLQESQKSNIASMEKQYKKLLNKSTKYDKQKSELENKIYQNTKKLDALTEQINAEKIILETIK